MANEKALDAEHGSDSAQFNDQTRSGTAEEEVARARHIQISFAPLRFLRQGEIWLDSKLGIETQGIDRIVEDDKRPPSIANVFFFWWSMTLHAGTLPIGFLGPEFGLSLNQSAAAVVVGAFLGALCPAYTGTLGPKVGSLLLPSLIRIDVILVARSSPNRMQQIFIWILGRQALRRSQPPSRRRVFGRECRRLWPDPEFCVGLYHDHQRGMCDCVCHFVRDLRVWIRLDPYIREVLLDPGHHSTLRSHRPSSAARLCQCSCQGLWSGSCGRFPLLSLDQFLYCCGVEFHRVW